MQDCQAQLEQFMPAALTGSVTSTTGAMLTVAGLPAPVGSLVEVERQTGSSLKGEVVGFRDDATLVYPLELLSGVRRGNRVHLRRTTASLRVGDALLGRVVDAQGRAIDQRPQPVLPFRVRFDQRPVLATERPRIDTPLCTGIRSIDGLLTCGRGQRMGIFSGSGVGKSVTLGMMARYTAADITVIALIGERGREVNEFVQRDLGAEGLKRSVVVVATSDDPAILRVRAAWTATAIAEYFREQGRDVLLVMDSLTRFALAQREIGLAAGEPPTTRGYPPSVFALLAKLVERAGRTSRGSITAFYSVLVEGDDPQEPISDAVRGLLDGHTWLSRKLAARGHYPAVDVLESISRLMSEMVDKEHLVAARRLRELLSAYRDHEDLISIGAYRRGSNPLVDAAIDLRTAIDAYLQQGTTQTSTLNQSREGLLRLIAQADARPTSAAAVATPASATG